jgi:predicted NBD/HSP70 family sugar kinase
VPGIHTRTRHRALVLGALRAAGPLSKAELARRLGLSVPTVTEILRECATDGVVEEVGEGRSTGGRRPMLYALRTQGLRAVGVNVDPDTVRAVISDLSGDIVAESTVPIDFTDGESAFVANLHRAVDTVLSTVESPDELAGIGVAVPAMMPRSAKGRFAPLGHPTWTGVDLHELVRQRYGLPVVTANRAHAVGVGEHLFGAGRGVANLLCLVLGSGLGAAVIAGGRLFTGGDGAAGVLGRMVLDAAVSDEPAPTVGEMVGESGIVAAAVARLRHAGRRTLGEVPLHLLNAGHVIDAALDGDALMADVLAHAGRVLGAAVAAALCVTDSDLVVLCGPSTRAGPLLLEPFQAILRARSPSTPPPVRLGDLGGHSGPLGAAALVLADFIRDAADDETEQAGTDTAPTRARRRPNSAGTQASARDSE